MSFEVTVWIEASDVMENIDDADLIEAVNDRGIISDVLESADDGDLIEAVHDRGIASDVLENIDNADLIEAVMGRSLVSDVLSQYQLGEAIGEMIEAYGVNNVKEKILADFGITPAQLRLIDAISNLLEEK